MKVLGLIEEISAANHSQVLEDVKVYLHSAEPVAASVEHALLRLQELMPPKPEEEVVLFRSQDMMDWGVFSVVFVALLCFDHFVLHGKGGEMDFRRALMYSCFWLSCAMAFCGYVCFSRGSTAGFNWATGYLLEWMLSVDNLFVFRSIFLIFHTPNTHKHKPLLWGICGAIVFRMFFFVVGEVMLHVFWWMHFVLGFFLIWTGYKIIGLEDDDDGEPNHNPIFLWITQKIKLIDAYSPEPKFLEVAAIDVDTGEPVLPDWIPPMLPKDCDMEACNHEPLKGRDIVYKCYATRLILVVICLELTDVVFALDSVSAIIAQIPDLFLAYTACVFAMLGLRATFFALDELVKLFTLLPYAVCVILVFIGAKLVAKGWIHIPHEIVCIVLVGVLSLSMVASVIYDKFKPADEAEEPEGKGDVKESADPAILSNEKADDGVKAA